MNPTVFSPRRHKALKAAMERITQLPYSTLFEIWAGLMIIFGLVYFSLSSIGDGRHGPSEMMGIALLPRLGNSIYFSIITGTTIGYGDITPHGLSKVFASIQAITAIFLFAIFVTKLVSHQQELMLREIHRMTFEDVFHNTREGLFIARRDLDHAIHEAEIHKTISWETWDNIITAYRQVQSLLGGIPGFYASDASQYTIDEERENLLLEAVHRTLHRINQLLDTLSGNDIDWISHEASLHELKKLVKVVSSIAPLWQQSSPNGMKEAFQDILQMKDRMHLKLEQAIPAQ